MRILNGYSSAENRNGIYTGGSSRNSESSFSEIIKNSGDTICFSDQAMHLLEHPGSSLNSCPHDAIYDQYGNVNRQLANLQQDLSNLTAAAWPVNVAVMPQINALKSQVSHLNMQI